MNEKQLEQFIIMQKDISNITLDVADVKRILSAFIERADEIYVNKLEFAPVKKVVYGLVGLILAGTFTALFSLIFR